MNGIMKARRDAYLKFAELARTREPCFETAEGVVHFRLTPNGLWEVGGACNIGLLVDVRFSYDHDETFQRNLERVQEVVCERYGEDGYENR